MKKKETLADFPKIGAPALRALQNAKIKNMNDLAKWSESDLAKLHGVGPKATKILKSVLKINKLIFKK